MSASKHIIRDIPRNIAWGLGWGITAAVFFSVCVVLIRLIIGPEYPSHAFGLSRLILVYFGVGIAGGTVLGVLRPLTRWRTGAAVTGVIVALPVYLGGAAALFGYPLEEGKIFAGIILSLILGSYMGLENWKQTYGKSKSDSRRGSSSADGVRNGDEQNRNLR